MARSPERRAPAPGVDEGCATVSIGEASSSAENGYSACNYILRVDSSHLADPGANSSRDATARLQVERSTMLWPSLGDADAGLR